MKSSVGKNKRPRVLANTVKKPERNGNGNLSGNRSFFNKSSNRYINDLRNNNAKLAHSLAAEKRKVAEVFRRYNDAQTEVLREQSRARAVHEGVKSGWVHLQSAVDSIFKASEAFEMVTRLFRDARNQSGGDTATTSQASAAQVIPQRNQEAPLCTPSKVSKPPEQLNSTVLGLTPGGNEPRPTTTTVIQGTARPMVQGQVISNPTISLQRVAVPTRCHLGKGKVKPSRGVLLELNPSELRHRLSEIPEHLNESHESRSSLGNAMEPYTLSEVSSNVSSLNISSRFSLPHSHVVLERLPRAPKPITSEALVDGDEEQHTVVHFGSMSYSDGIESEVLDSNPQPLIETRTCDTVVGFGEGPFPEAASVNPVSDSSDQFESASSSEDESLALRIAESKKCYLESNRQVEFKEGTSWNYDEKGKFCKQPPRKGRPPKAGNSSGKKHVEPSSKSRRSTKPVADLDKASVTELVDEPDNVKKVAKTPPKLRIVKQSPKVSPVVRSGSPNPASDICSQDKSSPMAAPSSRFQADTSLTSTTVVDMSFTCVEPPSKNLANHLHQIVNGPSALSGPEIIPFEDRQAYVTQRPRSRKAPQRPEASPDQRLSPTCSSLNNDVDHIKGTRDVKQPSLSFNGGQYEKSAVLNNHVDLAHMPSYVVLERLPNNYSGSTYFAPSSNDKDTFGPLKKSDSPASASNHESASKPRKRNDSSSDEDIGRPGRKPESLPSSNHKKHMNRRRKPGSARRNYGSDSSEQGIHDPPKKRRKHVMVLDTSSSSADDENADDESDEDYSKTSRKPMPRGRKNMSKAKIQDSKSFRISEDQLPKENARSLSASSSATFSASTSPIAPSESDPACQWAESSCDANGIHRPRRNAAPVSMKEPTLNTKMRRP